MDTLTIAGRSFRSRLMLGTGKYRSPQVMESVTAYPEQKFMIGAGAAAVMPMGAPIGSGLGIQNLTNLQILREQVTSVPLIVDAGVGTASDAVVAMELGYDAVLLNTAVASARDSLAMARAMRHAVIAGRLALEAGRMGRFLYANASSPGPDFSGPTPFPAATFQEYSSRHPDRGAPNAGQ